MHSRILKGVRARQKRLDITQAFQLQFEPPDLDRFPAIELGYEVARQGGTAGAVVNAANEAAVQSFLDGKLQFQEIVPACRAVLEQHDFNSSPTLDEAVAIGRLGTRGDFQVGVYLIGDISWWLMLSSWMSILKMVVGLGLVIFVHELGHFVVAKMCGVKCEKFYVGFDVPIKIGPFTLPAALFKKTGRRNGIWHWCYSAWRIRKNAWSR